MFTTGTSTSSVTACSAAGVDIYVKFTTDFGNLPQLTSPSSTGVVISISALRDGSKLNLECSARGICGDF